MLPPRLNTGIWNPIIVVSPPPPPRGPPGARGPSSQNVSATKPGKCEVDETEVRGTAEDAVCMTLFFDRTGASESVGRQKM